MANQAVQHGEWPIETLGERHAGTATQVENQLEQCLLIACQNPQTLLHDPRVHQILRRRFMYSHKIHTRLTITVTSNAIYKAFTEGDQSVISFASIA